MKKVLLGIFLILLLINCNNSQKESVKKSEKLELILESYKELPDENVKHQDLNKSKCDFIAPDTSVVNIKIRNIGSILKILGQQTKLEGDSTHIFYSSDKKQKLGLTIHSGDSFNQVSIFYISYSDNSDKNLQQINYKEFETEKGIKLGISKKEIIEKLGNCYFAEDSTMNSIVLNYTIKHPKDSKTKLLESNNMPIYYAKYKLKNDKLENIEFGFEYP